MAFVLFGTIYCRIDERYPMYGLRKLEKVEFRLYLGLF